MHTQCSLSTPKRATEPSLPLLLLGRFPCTLHRPARGFPLCPNGLRKAESGWPPHSQIDANPMPALPALQPWGHHSLLHSPEQLSAARLDAAWVFCTAVSGLCAPAWAAAGLFGGCCCRQNPGTFAPYRLLVPRVELRSSQHREK